MCFYFACLFFFFDLHFSRSLSSLTEMCIFARDGHVFSGLQTNAAIFTCTCTVTLTSILTFEGILSQLGLCIPFKQAPAAIR